MGDKPKQDQTTQPPENATTAQGNRCRTLFAHHFLPPILPVARAEVPQFSGPADPASSL